MNEERIKIGDGIRFRYTNYKGKKCVRYAIVKRIYTGSNEWHKVKQKLVDGYDFDKNEIRTYAYKDMEILRIYPSVIYMKGE